MNLAPMYFQSPLYVEKRHYLKHRDTKRLCNFRHDFLRIHLQFQNRCPEDIQIQVSKIGLV